VSVTNNTYRGVPWSCIKLCKTNFIQKETVGGDGTDCAKGETIAQYLNRKNMFHFIVAINGGFHSDGIGGWYNCCKVGNGYNPVSKTHCWNGSYDPNSDRWCYGIDSTGLIMDVLPMNTLGADGKYGTQDRTGFEKAHPYGITAVGALFVGGDKKPCPTDPGWPAGNNLRSIIVRNTFDDFYFIVCDDPGWNWNDACDFLQYEFLKHDQFFTVKDAVMQDGSTCAPLGYRVGTAAPVILQPETRSVLSKVRGTN